MNTRALVWSSFDGKMTQIDNTLKTLRMVGITKVKIVGDTEALEVELEKDGRCKMASRCVSDKEAPQLSFCVFITCIIILMPLG